MLPFAYRPYTLPAPNPSLCFVIYHILISAFVLKQTWRLPNEYRRRSKLSASVNNTNSRYGLGFIREGVGMGVYLGWRWVVIGRRQDMRVWEIWIRRSLMSRFIKKGFCLGNRWAISIHISYYTFLRFFRNNLFILMVFDYLKVL